MNTRSDQNDQKHQNDAKRNTNAPMPPRHSLPHVGRSVQHLYSSHARNYGKTEAQQNFAGLLNAGSSPFFLVLPEFDVLPHPDGEQLVCRKTGKVLLVLHTPVIDARTFGAITTTYMRKDVDGLCAKDEKACETPADPDQWSHSQI